MRVTVRFAKPQAALRLPLQRNSMRDPTGAATTSDSSFERLPLTRQRALMVGLQSGAAAAAALPATVGHLSCASRTPSLSASAVGDFGASGDPAGLAPAGPPRYR